MILHTLWGGRVNRPLAMALDAAWKARFGYRLELYVSNDSIVLQLPHTIAAEELLSLVNGVRIESLLRSRLEGSGFFGARFRECAGRALLLPRSKFNERMPLWLSRLKSQKLLEAVLNYEDFPILLEAWRSCMQDEFDLDNLKKVLEELESGVISWTEVHSPVPSPFAKSDGWRQVNQYMYMGDQPRSDKVSKLRGSLLREIVFTPGLRPTVARKLVEEFEVKRKRLSPGYSPQTSRELVDWVTERVAIPKGEWEDLLKAMQRDHGVDPEAFADLKDRLTQFHPAASREALIVAGEMLPRMIRTLYGAETSAPIQSLAGIPLPKEKDVTPEEENGGGLIGQWLQFYGPVTVEFIHATLGMESERLEWILEDLIDSQTLVQGQLVTDGEPSEVCDSENFERLLRLVRTEGVPSFEPLGIEWLLPFLANYQGITEPDRIAGVDGLRRSLEQMVCYPAEAGTWESEIFPARLHPYDPSWLDTLMQEGELLWIGGEGHRVTFCYDSELDLLQEGSGEIDGAPDKEQPDERISKARGSPFSDLFPDAASRYDFSTLLRLFKGRSAELAKELWEEVWKGRVTNDTFLSLRRVVMNRFRIPERVSENSEKPRRRESRLRRVSLTARQEGSVHPFCPGYWRLVSRPEPPEDLLEVEDLRKDRARLLLDRYGILFRELLQRECPALRWSSVFRALRIMELSGEVMAGIFFHGVPGPQFIFHRAFRRIQRKLPEESIYWINATDPASLCGTQLDSIRGTLPARVATTHLVYRGSKLIVVSKRNGKDLTFHVAPDDPSLPECMVSLRHLLTRKFQPVKRVSIETINGEEAAGSPYLSTLRTFSDIAVDYKNVTLYRKVW